MVWQLLGALGGGSHELGRRLLAIVPYLRALLAAQKPEHEDQLRRNVALHSVASGVDLVQASGRQLRAAQRGPRLDALSEADRAAGHQGQRQHDELSQQSFYIGDGIPTEIEEINFCPAVLADADFYLRRLVLGADEGVESDLSDEDFMSCIDDSEQASLGSLEVISLSDNMHLEFEVVSDDEIILELDSPHLLRLATVHCHMAQLRLAFGTWARATTLRRKAARRRLAKKKRLAADKEQATQSAMLDAASFMDECVADFIAASFILGQQREMTKKWHKHLALLGVPRDLASGYIAQAIEEAGCPTAS